MFSSSARTRSVLAAAFTLPFLALIFGVVSAPAAQACSLSAHCYASAVVTGHNNGVLGNIFFTCLNSPTDNDFVTDEMWDDTGTGGPFGVYWTEVGVIDGKAADGNVKTRNWFWAQFRPTDSTVDEHYPTGFAEAAFSTDYLATITYNGGSSKAWTVTGGDSGIGLGTSSVQPNDTTLDRAGTEYTDAQGLRDSGGLAGLDYEDSGSNEHAWGSNGGTVPNRGANADVDPSYDASTSTVSWNSCG